MRRLGFPGCLRLRAVPAILAGLILGLGCASAPENPPAQESQRDSRRFVLEVVQSDYLWPEVLPRAVRVEDFAGPEALLEHLLARARNEKGDRWSGIHAETDGELAEPARHARSQVSFGFHAAYGDDCARVAEVLPGSAAEAAGLRRGDWFLGADTLQDDRFQPVEAPVVPVVQGLEAGTLLGHPIGPGQRLVFRVLRGSGAVEDLEIIAARRVRAQVPCVSEPRVIDRQGRRVGYFQLRRFRRAAEPQLRRALRRLGREGITDLIVDLRYNPGGSSETVQLLANLLRADASAGEVMFHRLWRDHRRNQTIRFRAQAESVRLQRLAFIVTDHSASASEAVINALAPYFGQNLAVVGRRTHGKPVGCQVIPIPGTGQELSLVSYRLLNAAHQGDYYRGLPFPGFQGCSCAAEDDLEHEPGDPAEASTAAALHWIANGVGPDGPINPAQPS